MTAATERHPMVSPSVPAPVGGLGLRSRLLASYIALLLVTLSVVAGALLVILGSRPAPASLVWQELYAMLPVLYTEETLTEMRLPRLDAVSGVLDTFSETFDVRVSLVQINDERQAYTIYDSMDVFTRQQRMNLSVDSYSYNRIRNSVFGQPVFGNFYNPDGTEWLFSGYTRSGNLGRITSRNGTLLVMLSEQRPTENFATVLADFGTTLLPSFLQAGIIGLIVAVILAYLISRSVAKPLQALARGASDVASGQLNVSVPETGPKEVRAVAQAFNRMSAEVRATQESQRDFLANVSHDLKTPLTSIEGYSQAIMDGVAKDPPKAAKIIHNEAARLNRMVVELTDLARLQAGRLSMKMDALQLDEIVQAIGERLMVVAQRKDITLDVDVQPLPAIGGDGDRLVQVLTNLISNAIKYTPNGGHVWVTTGVRDGGVFVSVRDTGIGIAQDDLVRVFERFYQVDKARGPQRGTGLGLAITREIVQAHSGTIQVESAGKGKGSAFTIWLPTPHLSTIISRKRF